MSEKKSPPRQTGGPFPVIEIVKLLADATDHLLQYHSCDVHGYELWGEARDAARKWLSLDQQEGPEEYMADRAASLDAQSERIMEEIRNKNRAQPVTPEINYTELLNDENDNLRYDNSRLQKEIEELKAME